MMANVTGAPMMIAGKRLLPLRITMEFATKDCSPLGNRPVRRPQ
jgi:hypothetical protein